MEPDPYIIVRQSKGNKKCTVYVDQMLTKHLKEFINYKVKTLKQSIEDQLLKTSLLLLLKNLKKNL